MQRDELERIDLWATDIDADELQTILENAKEAPQAGEVILWIRVVVVLALTFINALILFDVFAILTDFFSYDFLYVYVFFSSVVNPIFMLWLAFRKYKIILIR